MSKLDAKVFSSITPFAKQWILGDELMYEFLNDYQDILSDSYGIVDLGSLNWNRIQSAGGYYYFQLATSFIGLAAGTDLYCDYYSIASSTGVISLTADKMIAGSANPNMLYIRDDSCATVEALQTALTGQYLVYRLAANVKRKSFVFNQANQANIRYFGTYSDLQTFYIDIGETEHIAVANIYLTSNNSHWNYKSYDEVDHSYRLQHGPEGTENVGRAYIFLTADNETAAREIINNDPVIVYCYYKNS